MIPGRFDSTKQSAKLTSLMQISPKTCLDEEANNLALDDVFEKIDIEIF